MTSYVAAVAAAAEEAGRLNRIADDLLLLSRGDQGQLPLHPEVTNIHELLVTIAHHAEDRMKAAGISCSVDAPVDLEGTLDRERIRQAIDNLVDNALRFSPTGSDLDLSARAHAEDLVIEVADHGTGFPTDFLPHAFERFSRPDSSRSRNEGGAGLGLAIVMAIAVAHGGFADSWSIGPRVVPAFASSYRAPMCSVRGSAPEYQTRNAQVLDLGGTPRP